MTTHPSQDPAPGQATQAHPWVVLARPRVAPLPRYEQGWLVRMVLRASRLKTDGPGGRGEVLNVFSTLARAPSLLLRWLVFASGLMPYGKLPRADTERIILRVGWRTGSWYEWVQHVRLGRMAGLSLEEIDALRQGEAKQWTPRTRALMQGVDALVACQHLDEGRWQALRQHLSETQCIEFCLLTGHYVMLAMTLNTLGVAVEPQFRDDLARTPGASDIRPFQE
jgi:alkylhydroperoxidase family enzyme